MEKENPIILCVDDEPVNLDLLEAVLTPKDYKVIKTTSPYEALKIVNKQKIDLVLLDVMMKELTGFEVCKIIKSDQNLRNIPVVMITALSSKEDRIEGIESGAEDFISKPFDKAEVLARVRMLLKVKSLNERLNSAYSNITRLISYGEETIKTFNSLNFNFQSNIDKIVEQVLEEKEEEKPALVLVGLKQNDAYKWLCYRKAQNKSKIEILKLDIYDNFSLPLNTGARIIFSNTPELIEDKRLQGFLKRAQMFSINISNMVCYLNFDFCILEVNFKRDVTNFDAQVLNGIVMQSLFLKSLSSQIKEVEDAFSYTVHALARAAEANDEDTGNHIVRVGEYSKIIAKKLNLDDSFIEAIAIQAQMHDVGKIHIPSSILKKPDKLTQDEFEEMKQHTIYGAKILGDHPRLKIAKSIAISHHEKFDGSGYPFGLRQEEIPIEGRITALADHYDALRNKRAYKPAYDHKTTYKIITEGDLRTKPEHFDPQILKIFKESEKEFEAIYEKLRG